ncbi:two-component system sensor histidine kinase CreC [uncultured Dechloromonas sp.]|uniref:two-component system sensor histidine kinase CreC n=1 Tax=uncultured Dechloromonas sp. TaxID=171719 RepID=UPI0025EF7324|nr:two-component system sensor histidine kinase CreC [uncultured Dechloromonas sp.]
MNISIRLFFGYFLIVGLAAWFVLNTVNRETEPGIRQATEETLVDTAHVLAEMAALELSAGRIAHGPFADAVRAAIRRSPRADISGVHKESIDFRIVVTDPRGIVVYDSKQAALGEDFSQWRDIARVLRGEYGARQTREDPYDPTSTVMHVAAPIVWQGELIGALSLAKPMASVAPYAERAARRVKESGLLLLAASAAIGLFFTGWLGWSIHRLRTYARAVSEGRKAEVPTGGGRQLSELAGALAAMREKLEGKQYVERYVQNLAHEMKSPLTAVIGAAEILEGDPPETDRHRFAASIAEQSRRLQAIIERMLLLARVEQLQSPEGLRLLAPDELLAQCIALRRQALNGRRLTCATQFTGQARIRGDAFLLQQAVLNLLDNAIEFSPEGGQIDISASDADGTVSLSIRDHGDGAPDYALPQLFARFYSLPRPATGRKSTGLGLALVREVARLHGGDAHFENHPQGGGLATLRLPAA